MRRYTPTLLSYVPPTSVGLRTSLLGRIMFVVAASALSLWILYDKPLLWQSQSICAVMYVGAIVAFGAGRVFSRRPIQILPLTFLLIAVINGLWPPDQARMDLSTRMRFGASHGIAYSALAYATLLVASITRPSDVARIIARFRTTPSALCLASIPFTTFAQLAGSFRDMLAAASTRLRNVGTMQRPYRLVISVAAALLASMLTRSLYLYQTTYAFSQPAPDTAKRALLSSAPFIAVDDIVFVYILLPGLTAGIIL